ncbi:MAG: hypothetical protein AAGD22_04115 [Verrucomicrobiota bacterium]
MKKLSQRLALMLASLFVFVSCETNELASSNSKSYANQPTTIGPGPVADTTKGVSDPARILKDTQTYYTYYVPIDASPGEAAAIGFATGVIQGIAESAAQANFNKKYGQYFDAAKTAVPKDIAERLYTRLNDRMKSEKFYAAHHSSDPSFTINLDLLAYGYAFSSKSQGVSKVTPCVSCKYEIKFPDGKLKNTRYFTGVAAGYVAPISEFAADSKMTASAYEAAINDLVTTVLEQGKDRLERELPEGDYAPISSGLTPGNIGTSSTGGALVNRTQTRSIQEVPVTQPYKEKVLSVPFGEPVSEYAMSRRKPYLLTQDTGTIDPVGREIRIYGTSYKIAGSEDGRVTLLMAKFFGPFFAKRDDPDNPLHKISEVLEENGLSITEVREVKNLGSLSGAYVITDGDGYSVIKSIGN